MKQNRRFSLTPDYVTAAARTKGRAIPGEAAIWVFILGDMVMFSMFFGQFIYDRAHQPLLFTASQRHLSIHYGAINTIILLTGSLFVVLGVEAVKKQSEPDFSRLTIDTSAADGRAANWKDQNASTWYFFLTLICAGIFAFDKILEYRGHLSSGITPATNNFFMYYYIFTGIHVLHLIISMIFLVTMLQRSKKSTPTAKDIRFIECGASFWHLVDLLWIALFAILYLLP